MAKSPYYVENRPLTLGDELRGQIDELEASVGRLGYGLGEEALTIPALFDAVYERLSSFQAQGHSMRAEEARLKTVSSQFRQKAKVFLREIGGVGVLQDARRRHQPEPSHWWWYLDRLEAEKKQARLRRTLLIAAGVIAILLLLLSLYQLFLAPDPATRERLRRQQNAESLALMGDLTGALSEVEQALAVAPNNPGLLVFKGTLQQNLGKEKAAEETFATAEVVLDDRELFLLSRARVYLLLEQAEAALADAQELIELNPESASGYLLMGRSYELSENYLDAIFAYEQAANLADMQGDAQLAATARVNLGILLQRQRAQ